MFDSMKKDATLMNHMKTNGIEYIHMVGIDNVVCKILDPLFIGLNYDRELDVSAKVLPKADPLEAVGVFCYKNKNVNIIEYSELGEGLARQTNEGGELAYNQGNILNFLIRFECLRQLLEEKAD